MNEKDTVTLIIETGVDISDLSTFKIDYRLESGTTGTWDATLSGTTKITTTFTHTGLSAIKYTVQGRGYTATDALSFTTKVGSFTPGARLIA